MRAALTALGPAAPSPVERLGLGVAPMPHTIRPGTIRDVMASARPRPSAVLAPLYDEEGEAWVVLTRRSAQMRSHSGEVSFPGGGHEPTDDDLTATAIREAWEEIRLDPATVDVFAELDHLSTITSGSYIAPFVAELPGRPELEADPAEVEAVLHVPLAELLLPEVYREERWEIVGVERPIVFFDLVGDTVWGATAAMLRQLLGFVTGTVARGELGHD